MRDHKSKELARIMPQINPTVLLWVDIIVVEAIMSLMKLELHASSAIS